MSLNISTNTAALKAGINLAYNTKQLHASMSRLSSGKKLSSPVSDPGSLAVSMKLQSSINRLAGARNNVQNATSFLEVQDGLLDTVGSIISRMGELKSLGSQDPMKSDQDVSSYNNEFKDLQLQLYSISQQKFNGVSLFANHTLKDAKNGADTATDSTYNGEVRFGGKDQITIEDHTVSVHTSSEGASGSKVSLHKALLLSALTLNPEGSEIKLAGVADKTNAATSKRGFWSTADNAKIVGGKSYSAADNKGHYLTLASEDLSSTLSLGQLSVGVLTTALENISFLRAQNGGTQSRLSFNADSLAQQTSNMQTALGRIVDVDIAEETMNLSKYNVLAQAAASMLAQANVSTDLALMLLR
jgi:flagellin-like hook-associated protein FlgL